jgi:hypothetical protein
MRRGRDLIDEKMIDLADGLVAGAVDVGVLDVLARDEAMVGIGFLRFSSWYQVNRAFAHSFLGRANSIH